MTRIEATYGDGLTATYDDSAAPVVTGDAELLDALDVQQGAAPTVKGGTPLLLMAYDASPEHFVAATAQLRAPERPTLVGGLPPAEELPEALPGHGPDY